MSDSQIFAWLGRASICGISEIEHAAEVMKNYYQGIGPEPEYQEIAKLRHPDGSMSTYKTEYEINLESDLAEIRDLLLAPEHADELADLWSEAMSEARAVVPYVKAYLRVVTQAQEQAKKAGATCNPPEDSRQLVVIGGQRLGKSSLLELQRDAARYRWLCDKADDMLCTKAPMVASLDDEGRMIGLLDGEELDAAVDAAKALRPPKTKLTGSAR